MLVKISHTSANYGIAVGGVLIVIVIVVSDVLKLGLYCTTREILSSEYISQLDLYDTSQHRCSDCTTIPKLNTHDATSHLNHFEHIQG